MFLFNKSSFKNEINFDILNTVIQSHASIYKTFKIVRD